MADRRIGAMRRDAKRWRELLRQHTSDDKRSLCIARYDSKAEQRIDGAGKIENVIAELDAAIDSGGAK